MQALYGDTLPWPLNYFIPYSHSVTARRHFKGRDPAQARHPDLHMSRLRRCVGTSVLRIALR